ncbi:MAG: type II toxin-antitoxin system VapB family antitoxin [Opitutaceae bacterium]|jgi:Arc/MetJ family transcription regulator
MKTTIDLPEKELAEAMKHANTTIKTEAVARAVSEFNRRARLAKLAEKLGTFRDLITPEELQKMRSLN